MQPCPACYTSRCLILINKLEPHALNHCQIVIKCAPGLRRHSNRVARQSVIARRPMTGTAAHCDARQDDSLTTFRCAFAASCDNHGGGALDHLKIVSNCLSTLEKQQS